MEKGALTGMISLAISDLLFCLVTLSGTYLPPSQMVYNSRNFVYYYTLYGNCVQNIFIKTSTWFTVILAMSRHFVVSQPIRARQYMKCRHTMMAIVICLIIWIGLNIPLAYLWTPIEIQCPGGTLYILDAGPFVSNHSLKMGFTYFWFIIGFVIPVGILAYSNTRLLLSLQGSRRLRQNSVLQSRENRKTSEMSENRRNLVDDNVRNVEKNNDDINNAGRPFMLGSKHSTGDIGQRRQHPMVCRQHSSADGAQRRITYTLIAIVSLFFFTILPSEIILMYQEIKKPDYNGAFRYALIIANLLQAFNFSGNFAMYCIVNAYFRKTILSWLMWCFDRESGHVWRRINNSQNHRSSVKTQLTQF